MFKRLTWFGIGAAAGATGFVWAQQRVRRELDALGPDHLAVVAAHQAGRVTRQAARTVAGAVSDGRSAMRDREDELLARRDARRPGGSGAARSSSPRPDAAADRSDRPEPWRGRSTSGADRRPRPARW